MTREQEVSHVMQACGLDRQRALRHVIACERFLEARRNKRAALTPGAHGPGGLFDGFARPVLSL